MSSAYSSIRSQVVPQLTQTTSASAAAEDTSPRIIFTPSSTQERGGAGHVPRARRIRKASIYRGCRAERGESGSTGMRPGSSGPHEIRTNGLGNVRDRALAMPRWVLPRRSLRREFDLVRLFLSAPDELPCLEVVHALVLFLPVHRKEDGETRLYRCGPESIEVSETIEKTRGPPWRPSGTSGESIFLLASGYGAGETSALSTDGMRPYGLARVLRSAARMRGRRSPVTM